MPRRHDIDDFNAHWPYRPGAVAARLVRAKDGRQVVQMRVDLGLLQMEIHGRPDGAKPGGMETCLDWLSRRARTEGEAFEITEEDAIEVERELQQFYHRRVCWLALHEFRRAVADADHVLELMDFIAAHAREQSWIACHERYRSFVLFQRTQAAALAALEKTGPELAVEELDEGLRQLRLAGAAWDDQEDEVGDEEEMAAQLLELKEWIRGQYRMGRTLGEQLAEAVASEKYELAARLRDEIARRRTKSR